MPRPTPRTGRTVLAATTAGLVLGLAGCGGEDPGPAGAAAPRATGPPGSAAGSPTAAQTRTTPAPDAGGAGGSGAVPGGDGAPGGERACRAEELVVVLGPPDASASGRSTLAVLRKRAPSAAGCAVRGYGTLTLLDAARRPLPTRFTRTGDAAGRVPLGRGGFDRAARLLRYSAVPAGPGGSPRTRCPDPAYLAVTLDGVPGRVVTPWTGAVVCDGDLAGGPWEGAAG